MSILEFKNFLPIANAVAEHGIRYFVEPSCTSDIAVGMEAAQRLGLHGFVGANGMDALRLSQYFPDFDVYDGVGASMLADVLPRLDAPAIFWLDPHSATSEEEMAILQVMCGDRKWFFEFKDVAVPGDALVSEDRHDSQAANIAPADGGNEPGPLADFDRNWQGPEEDKPRVYRTQLEKDTWFAVACENEYNVPALQPSDLVIDIGGHIGSFAYIAQKMGSRNIHVFEVDPWHFEALRANLDGMEGITLYPCAVVRGDAARKPEYCYSGKWNVFEDEGVPVDSVSLDEIIADLGPVRFLKTDCEGSEFPILYTSSRLESVQEIAGEFHEHIDFDGTGLPPLKMAALADFLHKRGFAVQWKELAPGIGHFGCWR